MKNIWKTLPKPIMALAPMEGVTDTVFRQIISDCGKPSIFFTEFTNVDGLFSKGAKTVEHRLVFERSEKPLIAQLWGMKLENYADAAKLIEKAGFDGIDINMGCPEKKVVKRGACAGLIHNHDFVAKIVKTVRDNSSLPVSIKTRIGIEEVETDKWIPFLLEQKLDALTVHLRTVREQSEPPPHWEEMDKIVELRNEISPSTLIIANGDILNMDEARGKINKHRLDGVMIGRGIFHDPYLFNANSNLADKNLEQRLELLLKHAALFEKSWGKNKNFAILKKFFKIYTLGLPNASELRIKLMEANNYSEIVKIHKIISKNMP